MWVEQAHECRLLTSYHGSHLGQLWECPKCLRAWVVVSERGPNEVGQYTHICYVYRKENGGSIRRNFAGPADGLGVAMEIEMPPIN